MNNDRGVTLRMKLRKIWRIGAICGAALLLFAYGGYITGRTLINMRRSDDLRLALSRLGVRCYDVRWYDHEVDIHDASFDDDKLIAIKEAIERHSELMYVNVCHTSVTIQGLEQVEWRLCRRLHSIVVSEEDFREEDLKAIRARHRGIAFIRGKRDPNSPLQSEG